MSSLRRASVQQLPLFPVGLPTPAENDAVAPSRRAPAGPAGPGLRPAGRNARMADRLDRMAAQAERDAAACRRAGDEIGVRRALEQARDARRAAALLRAGPSRVREVLAS